MAHQCRYFHYKNGQLLCVQCGKSSDRPVMAAEVIEEPESFDSDQDKPKSEPKMDTETEDKMAEIPENKGHIIDTEGRRTSLQKAKGKKKSGRKR